MQMVTTTLNWTMATSGPAATSITIDVSLDGGVTWVHETTLPTPVTHYVTQPQPYVANIKYSIFASNAFGNSARSNAYLVPSAPPATPISLVGSIVVTDV